MDSDSGLTKLETQASNATTALTKVRTSMQAWTTMTSSDPRLSEILGKLVNQKTAFNVSLAKSTTMFKSSAQTAKKVEELLKTLKTLDAAGLEKMAEGLQREVKETADQVKEIYEGLRQVNSGMSEISRDVTQLAAELETEKQQTQTEYDQADAKYEEANNDAASAHRRKSSMLKGCGWGTAVLLCLFWPAIPFWCCYTGCGAVVADKQETRHTRTAEELGTKLESLTGEIKLLSRSEEKTSVIRGSLPNLIKGFEEMYNFYVSIDTQVKDIRIDPKAKARLRHQQYVTRWGALHRQLERHHAELEAAADQEEMSSQNRVRYA